MKMPRSALLVLLSEVLGRGAQGVFQLLVARVLGASLYGSFAVILASCSTLAPVADLGLQNLALRHFAGHRDNAALSGLLAVKLMGLAVFALLALPLSLCLAGPGDHLAFGLGCAFYASTSVADFLRQVMRAGESPRAEFQARLIYAVFLALALAVLLVLRPGVTGVLWLYVLPPAGLALVYLRTQTRIFGPVRPTLAAGVGLIRRYWKFLLQAVGYFLVTIVYLRADVWLLNTLMQKRDVGGYYSALNTILTGTFLSQALASHLYARLAKPSAGLRELGKAAGAHLVMGCGMMVFLWCFGKPLFLLVFHGADFVPAAHIFVRLAVLLALISMNNLFIALLVGMDKMWVSMLCTALTTVIKLTMGWRLVPLLGLDGMATAAIWGETAGSLLLAVLTLHAYLRRPAAGNAF